MAYALWRVRDGEGRTRSRIRSNRAEMRPVDTENGFHAKIRILSESVSCRRKIRGGGPKRTTPSPRCGRGRFAEAEACLCGSGRMRLRRYRNGCFPYGGFGLRCRLQLFGSAMPVAVGRGCHAVLFAEEFDEVRGVGKGACGADFGDRLVGRDQKQPGMDQALPDEPLVGRGPVDAENSFLNEVRERLQRFAISSTEISEKMLE